jgi:FkbM family methyltransferase
VRKILIDCGANVGGSLRKFMDDYPDSELFAFEPNSELISTIANVVASGSRPQAATIANQAVWIRDGTVDLFLGHHESSTLLEGKTVPRRYNQQIDYTAPRVVPCIDFSAWIRRTFSEDDEIIVKMNIEGAEYPVLSKMVEDETLGLVSALFVEWHYDRFGHMTREDHLAVVEQVASYTTIEPWGQLPVDDGGPGLL